NAVAFQRGPGGEHGRQVLVPRASLFALAIGHMIHVSVFHESGVVLSAHISALDLSVASVDVACVHSNHIRSSVPLFTIIAYHIIVWKGRANGICFGLSP